MLGIGICDILSLSLNIVSWRTVIEMAYIYTYYMNTYALGSN